MSAERLRMRLYEKDRLREEWEAHIDPDNGKAMRFALLGAIEDYGVEEDDPRDALPRFRMEWQGRTGGWKTFRAGS